MEFLVKLGPFIVLLGLIIFVHEFGHFITAKAFGMRVFIFSLGFGKRLFGFKWGDTDCRISLIPLGGYVKLEGEPDDRLSEDTTPLGDAKDFTARPRWQRLLVYIAGPTMNAVLTFTIMTVLFSAAGGPADATPKDPPVLGAVDPGSPADAAGLRPGDLLLAIGGQPVADWEWAQYKIMLRPDAEFRVRVRRGGEELELPIRSTAKTSHKLGEIGVHPLVRAGEVTKDMPAAAAGLRSDDGILAVDGKPVRSFRDDFMPLVKGSKGEALHFRILRGSDVLDIPVTPRLAADGYKVGVGPKLIHRTFAVPQAMAESIDWMWTNTRLTYETLKGLLSAQVSVRALSGPLGIAQISSEAAKRSAADYFFVVALISLQVGLLNLFPLVPLDGGHMAVLMVESVARRDLSPAVKAWIMNAGAILVLLLVAVVLYSDVSKWFDK